jgi:class 3 adenylate cyclase/tetratricopeptide (TPR) repeat protein
VPICPNCSTENPEGFRHCGFCGASLTESATERRKLATLVFCDLSGSTTIGERADSETVRSLMLSYFHEMRSALEGHGGTVEKFVGDAVLAVFGVPEAHEDDALRACRAALEMQARLASLNEEFERRFATRIALRIGVNTGEVVAGDASSRETFVTGDPVNVAARLEQGAGPGEVLIGESTFRLVHTTAKVDAIEPLRAKGKTEPVAAYRLREISGSGPAPRTVGPSFTGRSEQLDLLERELQKVGAPECRLVTVIGEPGVGKSRLVSEFVTRIGTRARVVRGTCLSYGEGITYWAVGQIVRELAGIEDEHSSIEARQLIAAHVAREPNGDAVAAKIQQLLGLTEGTAAAEETALAIRDFLVASARTSPLVVLIDDIQWAEPTLLDLIAALPAAISDAPVLLIALSRPELQDDHPDWNATVQLEPFGEHDVDALLRSMLGTAEPRVRTRLASASGGNPLFLEELVAMLVEDNTLRFEDGGCVLVDDLDALALPTSLHALLGARLDRLEPDLRATLERCAIEGEVFHRGPVVQFSAPASEPSVRRNLDALVAKGLIRAAGASFVGEAAFRFKHILVRETAYQSTTKKLRAGLHERFANWLEQIAGGRLSEYEEILGYHLEQSYRYHTELGPANVEIQGVGKRAASHLAEAGRRAVRRGDIGAASGLLGRAAALLPAGHPNRAPILVLLGDTLMDAGRNTDALRAFNELDGADGVDEVSRTHAELCRAELELQMASTAATVDEYRRKARAAIELFAAHGEEQALLRACWVSYLTSMFSGRSIEAQAAIDRLSVLTGHLSRQLAGRLPGMQAMNLAWGPTPVTEALAATAALLEITRDDPAAEPVVLGAHAYLLSQAGDIDAARHALDRMREIADRQGQRVVLWSSWGQNVGRTELLAGDPARAEQALRPCYDSLRAAGLLGFSGTVAGQLAHALVELRRLDEAAAFATAAREEAGEADVLPQVLWRSALARSLAARGKIEEALVLADEAVRTAGSTEWPNVIADALLDQARVLRHAGRPARLVAERASVVYVAKGNAVGQTKAAALATGP